MNHGWAAVYHTVVKRMLDYQNKSEVLKVDAQALEAPNEPHIDIKHSVMQARGERHQRLFHAFSRRGANEILFASVARQEEHQRMIIILEQKMPGALRLADCPAGENEHSVKGCSGHISRADFPGNQGLRGADLQRKIGHVRKKFRLERLKKQRERGRVPEAKEMRVVKGAVTSTASCSRSPSLARK